MASRLALRSAQINIPFIAKAGCLWATHNLTLHMKDV
jgi:hypothetical protein